MAPPRRNEIVRRSATSTAVRTGSQNTLINHSPPTIPTTGSTRRYRLIVAVKCDDVEIPTSCLATLNLNEAAIEDGDHALLRAKQGAVPILLYLPKI